MKAVLVSAALFIATVSAQTFQINTPVPNPPVCLPVQLTWTGGSPPYFLSVRDGNSGMTIETLGSVDGTSFRWVVNQPVGTSLGLDLRDNNGNLAQSGTFQVATGADTSCVGQSPSSASSGAGSSSTTGAAPGSSTAGATSSGTVSVTTSTSVSVTSSSPSVSVTAPGVSTTSAGTAGATTSGSSTRASSTGSAASSGASSASSSSQASSAKSFAEMSAAGVFGAIAVALFA